MKKTCVVFYFWLFSPAFCQQNLPTFFHDLYVECHPFYQELKYEDYKNFCQEYSLDTSVDINQTSFYQLSFFHDLFTGSDARDFVAGGILEIPYCWHWVNLG